jgi:hypothetical protein
MATATDGKLQVAREAYITGAEEFAVEMARAGKWGAPLAAAKQAQARRWMERQTDESVLHAHADRLWKDAFALSEQRVERMRERVHYEVHGA